MLGLMMNQPLLISGLLQHADENHGDTEIVSRQTDGTIHRYTYHAAHRRARQLARALQALGTMEGDRIGTLAWNSYRHFEIYYAVSGMGAICHTINPRLFPEQLAYIINHAGDQYIFFDLTFTSLIETLAPLCPGIKGWIALCEKAALPATTLVSLHCYEDLLEAHDDDFIWPEFDENTASSLCYTSGTTGHPKGVLYSHRSTLLHALVACLPDTLDISARDCILPVVPMFHANAWALPYTAALAGAKLVLPGPHLDGPSLYTLFETEGVTLSAGVPTIWLSLLQHLESNKFGLTTLKRLMVGGSAAPLSMMQAFDRYGVTLLHVWGMTETSPLGTVNTWKRKHLEWPEEDRNRVRIKQGRVPYGIRMKIVDGSGQDLPHDGKAFGDLLVRGPWVACRYFNDARADVLRDGWFPTGDVATIDADGYMQITDRSKDVIKSGGEWISSIDLENIAVAHPAVAEAAVVGVPHPKWDERPLLVVVLKPGQHIGRDELLAFYAGKVAKWWIPDDVVFVAELPHTATGKLSKLTLREQLRDYRFHEECPRKP